MDNPYPPNQAYNNVFSIHGANMTQNTIRERLEIVLERVARAAERAGREPSEVRIVAVSKTKPAAMVREGFEAGLRIFGENKIQEAESKIRELAGIAAEWHFIGALQTNKAAKAAAHFALIHSVDRIKLANRLREEADKLGKTVRVLLQVNLSREDTKSGALPEEFEALAESVAAAPSLECLGLMTIPPPVDDPEEVRTYFRRLRDLAGRYGKNLFADMERPELSMGMSHDFETAIEEGATLIRVGTALFGERVYP